MWDEVRRWAGSENMCMYEVSRDTRHAVLRRSSTSRDSGASALTHRFDEAEDTRRYISRLQILHLTIGLLISH